MILIQVAGDKCNLCGYNRLPDALEFHHIIPEEKDFTISSTSRALENDLKEIQKCILVCANCHREIHKNFYTIEELKNKQIYNEEIAIQALEDRDKILHKIKKHCSKCGKELSSNAKVTGLCHDCYIDSCKKVDKRPSREELKSLIREKPFTAIGNQYGVSDKAITKWC